MTDPGTPALRLRDAWRQAERHVYHMGGALAELRALRPIDTPCFAGLSDAQVRVVDQFVLRFSKLQDVLGTRIFPDVLAFLEEPYERRPMLDKLNQLEKLGLIPSVARWQQLREIRNRFTHDYPDDPERNATNLNLALDAATEMLLLLQSLHHQLMRDHPELQLEPMPGV